MKSLKALTITDVMQKIGAGRTFIYAAMQAGAGTLPKPIRVGRRSCWIESEIDQWLIDRIAERDAGLTETDRFTQRARAVAAAREANKAVAL